MTTLKQLSHKSSMMHWLPILAEGGIPFPKTATIPITSSAHNVATLINSGKNVEEHEPILNTFIDEMNEAAENLGYPVSLRTEYAANQTDWETCCSIYQPDSMKIAVLKTLQRVTSSHSYKHLLIGHFALSEAVDAVEYGICPTYGNAPITKIFSFFIKDGVVNKFKPFWSEFEIKHGGADPKIFKTINTDRDIGAAIAIASRISMLVTDSWRVEIAKTTNGWTVIDMQENLFPFIWKDEVVVDSETKGPLI